MTLTRSTMAKYQMAKYQMAQCSRVRLATWFGELSRSTFIRWTCSIFRRQFWIVDLRLLILIHGPAPAVCQYKYPDTRVWTKVGHFVGQCLICEANVEKYDVRFIVKNTRLLFGVKIMWVAFSFFRMTLQKTDEKLQQNLEREVLVCQICYLGSSTYRQSFKGSDRGIISFLSYRSSNKISSIWYNPSDTPIQKRKKRYKV